MGQAYDDIRAAGGDAVAVFQYRPEPTRNFCRKRDVPFPCLADPERAAYLSVGLDRGAVGDYVSPKVAISFVRAVRHGNAPGRPDPHAQRPGTFVVGRDGRLLLAHYNADASDNVPVEDVLEAVRRGSAAVAG